MKLKVDNLEIEVRPGRADDIPLLLSFMRSLAEFERLEFTATEDGLRDALFSDKPAANAVIAEVDGKPGGYATYFFTFASSVGRRGLWLDDVYVNPDYRGKGIGKVLMTYVADIAARNNCARFEWMVLDWNESAIEFYEDLGATVMPDWRVCRIDGDQLLAAAEQISKYSDEP